MGTQNQLSIPIKVSNPGRLQIYRYISPDGIWQGDVLGEQPPDSKNFVYSLAGEGVSLPENAPPTPLLTPKMIGGERGYHPKPYTIVVTEPC